MSENKQNPKQTNVLTIDDHPIFRRGIHHLLESEQGINPLAEVDSIESAVIWLGKQRADVVLLDHNLTDGNGVDGIPDLLEVQSDLEIIMLTVSDDNDVFMRAIRNGACGYVLKDSPPESILEAISAANSGECRVSDSLVRCLFEGVSNKPKNNGSTDVNTLNEQQDEEPTTTRSVTPRETEILQQLVKGLSNKEIAKALYISPNTVRNQLQKLQEVFSARNRVQLALFAYDEGIGGIR